MGFRNPESGGGSHPVVNWKHTISAIGLGIGIGATASHLAGCQSQPTPVQPAKHVECYGSLEDERGQEPMTRKELALILGTLVKPVTKGEQNTVLRRMFDGGKWRFSDIPTGEVDACTNLTNFNVYLAALRGDMKGQGSCYGRPEIKDCKFNRTTEDGEPIEEANSAELLATLCKVIDPEKCQKLSAEISSDIETAGWGGEQWFTPVANKLVSTLASPQKEALLTFLKKHKPGDPISRQEALDLLKLFRLY